MRKAIRNRNKKETIAGIIAERKNHAQDREGYISLCVRILYLVLAGWLLCSHVFLLTQAKGNDMFPAVKDGDLVIAFRLQQEYAKNDVVVYTADGKRHIGRIAARGEDIVTLNSGGTVLVNGTAQDGEILYPTYAKEGLTYPYSVPKGEVFLLGDYRTQTEDSRDFGSIPLEEVEGKVITILRRRGL